jgi:hypothetical protein
VLKSLANISLDRFKVGLKTMFKTMGAVSMPKNKHLAIAGRYVLAQLLWDKSNRCVHIASDTTDMVQVEGDHSVALPPLHLLQKRPSFGLNHLK